MGGYLNGSFRLAINTNGITGIEAVVGNQIPLASLTTDIGGRTFVGTNRLITTSGPQTYNDPVILGQTGVQFSMPAQAILTLLTH